MDIISDKEYLPVWKADFEVCAYHVDKNSHIRLNILTSLIQEAAWQHASHLDLGIDYMHRSGLAWMLIRMYIEMDEFPLWLDKITIETWPKGTDGLFFVRDMLIWRNSKKIGSATTYWMLVDVQTKRPKIPELHTGILSLNKDRHALEKKPGKIRLESPVFKDRITARTSDIDINNHVNSNKYIEWIVNNLPEPIPLNKKIRSIQVNYLNEIKLDEVIILNTSFGEQSGEIFFEGLKEHDLKPCFQAVVKVI